MVDLTMRVEGEAARHYMVVRLDSFTSVEGNGVLRLADDQTGEVHWTDKTGESKTAQLGQRTIKVVRRHPPYPS